MKKIILFATFAFLASSIALAHDGDKKPKAKKTSGKTCGKVCSKKRLAEKA